MSFLSALDFDSKKLSSLFGVDGALKTVNSPVKRVVRIEAGFNSSSDKTTPFSTVRIGTAQFAENTLDVIDGEGEYYHIISEPSFFYLAAKKNEFSNLGVDTSAVFGGLKIEIHFKSSFEADFALIQPFTITTEDLHQGISLAIPMYPIMDKIEIYYKGFVTLEPPVNDLVRCKLLCMLQV